MSTKNLILGLALSLSIAYIFTRATAKLVGEPLLIGDFYGCNHGLLGEVWVLNDKQIKITGLRYNKGPGREPYFHAQLKGSKAIYTSDIDMYVFLPYPDQKCDKLPETMGGTEITLTLPRSIKDFLTIGIFSDKMCFNYGHIHIPENLQVMEAPSSVQKVNECSKKNNNDYCQVGMNLDNVLFPSCSGGNEEAVKMNTTFIQNTTEVE